MSSYAISIDNVLYGPYTYPEDIEVSLAKTGFKKISENQWEKSGGKVRNSASVVEIKDKGMMHTKFDG